MNAGTRVIEVRVPDMGNFKDVARHRRAGQARRAHRRRTPLSRWRPRRRRWMCRRTVAGIVEQVHVAKGGKVSAGDLVATRGDATGAARGAAPAAHPGRRLPRLPTAAAPALRRSAAPAAAAPRRCSPGCRALPGARRRRLRRSTKAASRARMPVRRCARFARELGVDLARVSGTGFKGRITQDDVKAFVKQALSGGGAAAAAARRGRAALPSVPVVGFRALRAGGDQAADAHPENLRTASACQLGEPAACHAVR